MPTVNGTWSERATCLSTATTPKAARPLCRGEPCTNRGETRAVSLPTAHVGSTPARLEDDSTMVVTAEITVPADTFALGSLFQTYPDVVVEFEPLVPLQSDRETNLPLVWIGGVEPDAVLSALTEIDGIDVVARLATDGEKTLFELEWSDELDGIVQPLLDTGGRILTARGTVDHWTFRLLFDSHVSLSEFNMAVTGNGIPVTLRRLSSSTIQRDAVDEAGDRSLPPNHRETLLLAYHSGYYDTPRECQLADLAAKENVSDSALSKRIRRATASLIEHTLLADEDPEAPPRD